MPFSSSGIIRISSSHIVLEYELVYDCKAEVITGVGISSATPSSQEVVEGDSCTFDCTLTSSDWSFYGWYESSDFSGTPVSQSQSYTVSSVTQDITLYPKAQQAYNIYVYGDTTKFSYVCSASNNKAFSGDSITITVTPSNQIYKFSGIYEADVYGNKTSVNVSNDNPYTFTMGSEDVYLYIEIGKEVLIYIDCLNCSLSSVTSPITSSVGKTETIELTYDSSSYDWLGIYFDSQYTNRATQSQTYSFIVGNNDIYLYAKAILKQQIYVKEDGSWVGYSKVYKKENGTWVEQTDLSSIFDTTKNYKRIEL